MLSRQCIGRTFIGRAFIGRKSVGRKFASWLLVLASAYSPFALANAPEAAGSLFDRIFRTSSSDYAIPYPFDALLARVDEFAGVDSQGASQLKRVLIPFGRSLQRHAAGPNLAASPRLVVAADTAGPPTSAKARLNIADRIFFGYQPAAQSIEVISYDDAIGQFDFLVITNYNGSARPSVVRPDRRLCTVCHQNQGPIFAEDSWDETNANPAILRQIRDASSAWSAAWVEQGPSHAAAIDNATDRANLLPVYHHAWPVLCQSPSLGTSASCRAGGFLAMLQQRLGPFSFYTPRDIYTRAFAPIAERNWARAWPTGLSIPNPDLLDRDPSTLDDPMQISAAHDPLSLRSRAPPWRLPAGLTRLIIGLSENFPDAELRRLDRHLQTTIDAREDVPQRSFSGGCAPPKSPTYDAPRTSRRETRGELECTLHADGPKRGSARAAPNEAFTLHLTFNGAGWVPKHLFAFDGTRFFAIDSMPSGAPWQTVDKRETRVTLTLSQRHRGLSLRLGDGSRVRELTLISSEATNIAIPLSALSSSREQTQDQTNTHPTFRPARASLTLVDDFADVVSAAERLASRPAATNPLGTAVFQPARLFGALLVELGLETQAWCCDPKPALTSPPSSPKLPSPSPAQGVRARWQTYCGSCHDQPFQHPPRFLREDDEATQLALEACAPSALFRLSLWQTTGERPVAPMPPPAALAEHGLTERSWLAHPDYAALIRDAQGWINGTSTARSAGGTSVTTCRAETE